MILRQVWKPLLLLLLGGMFGWFLSEKILLSPQQIRGATLRQSNISYPFISPLLACDVGSEEAFPEFAPLKRELTDIINKEIATGNDQRVSVYLRSLRSAKWFEINGNQTYAPASLLKIFVMMAYYKEADEADDPGILQEQIPFESSAYANDGTDVVGGTIAHLTSGNLYTVDQLINQMIIYSDNDAYATLVNHFDSGTVHALEGISSDLNVPLPVTHAENSLDFMSVDKYSMIFRVLFGSTYLSERYSEKALQLLSQAKYTTGIVAGVPAPLVVAHKYGIRAVATPTATAPNELHDCGIVYYPNHPYLLCVMTSGRDLVAEQNTIKNISQDAYQWLDVYYKTLPSDTATTTPATVGPSGRV